LQQAGADAGGVGVATDVSGKALVISKSQIVERGAVNDVLVHPTHPYTQMLLSSLPAPDPDARWHDKLDDAEVAALAATESDVLSVEGVPAP
jgi:ABC-type oligopeptide transport system ATPase subunit